MPEGAALNMPNWHGVVVGRLAMRRYVRHIQLPFNLTGRQAYAALSCNCEKTMPRVRFLLLRLPYGPHQLCKTTDLPRTKTRH